MEVSKTLQPSDYGLPYDEFWTGQLESIEAVQALFKEHDVVFLNADTGTGKTGIGTAISSKFSTSSVLCPTISLEEQYGSLTGREVGRGRRWHPCYLGNKDAFKCMQLEECSPSIPCAYRIHMSHMKGQRMRIMNYAQWLAMNQATDGGWSTQLVVADEGHGLESHLLSFADMWEEEQSAVWGSEYHDWVFNHGEKFLIMSASMIPSLVAECMGIQEYGQYEAKNNFEPDRNPVFVKPVGFITAKRPHTNRIIKAIDYQLSISQLNGIVHCSSDRQCIEILEGTKYPERFIYPKGQTRADSIRKFKSAGAGSGAVLISAGMYEGQDFPDDECRWQIICKVPYASLGDARVAARRMERPDVYRLEALQKIQQACGRGMRNPDDWCTTTILDGTVVSLYEKLGDRLSSKFRESWRGLV